MVKVDLITGFLGAGKTTFLLKYAKYLIDNGENVCILENDYGPVNVDMMLLDSLNCDREMISGGCDFECHQRRFRTKLITMGIKGYTRVIIEPSGIFEPDEFLDLLYEEPLDSLYEIGNIFCIYDINTKDLSYESRYILASEASVSSKLIVSKRENNELVNLYYINNILKEFNSNKRFTNNDVYYTNNLKIEDIINSGYSNFDHIKIPVNKDNNYDSLYFLDINIDLNQINKYKEELFNNNIYGNVVRIKGFILNNDKWISINYTRNENNIINVKLGQKVIIVIGEDLNKELINKLFNGE